MASIETMISWMWERKGNVQYSMANRYGPNSYDSSSSIYNALIAGELFKIGKIGTADTLFSDLEENGWVLTNRTNAKRGDIFIFGRRGYANGNYGHVGIFLGNSNVIHCNIENNGITMNSYNSIFANANNPPSTIYTNPNETAGNTPEDQETLNNTGELENLGIKNGKIVATGWHYSNGMEEEYISFIDATTDIELGRIYAQPVERLDIKEKHPNSEAIEKSGFDVEFIVPNETAVYVRGIKTNGYDYDYLTFNKIIIFEQAFDPEVETYAKTQREFFIEVYNKNKLVKRINKTLSVLRWSNELMSIPNIDITIPIEYSKYFQTRAEVKIYINNKVFHGITTGIVENKDSENISIAIDHVIREWKFRQISTNLAAKNRTINDIYSTLDFRYPNWNIEYLQDSAERIIDYVYSRQDKLDGLTKTCELTDDLFWRVGFNAARTLDIGTFGEKLPYMILIFPTTTRNIRLIKEPIIRHNYNTVINMATVYGEKSDSGMSSMSLREVFEEKGSQLEEFPVVILKNGINNERSYNYIEFTKLAPNNEIEYTVIDSESIALEGGLAIEGTFSFNDLAPFSTDGDEITDEDRAKAAMTAYQSAVKKLRQSRRRYQIEIVTEELPYDVNIGDRIRFIYDNSLLILDECSNYQKKILSFDDWYYIISIDYEINEIGNETNTLVLEKELRTSRESEQE